jgi:hypothetical protein
MNDKEIVRSVKSREEAERDYWRLKAHIFRLQNWRQSKTKDGSDGTASSSASTDGNMDDDRQSTKERR